MGVVNQAVQDAVGGRGIAAGRVHAHVEGAVALEGESPAGRVELVAADTEVEHDAIEGAGSDPAVGVLEVAVMRLEPAHEGAESFL